MTNKENNQYFNMNKNDRDAVIGYLLNSLIHARQSCGLPSNEKGYDEDVNIYLAHLLFALSLPEYRGVTGRYLKINTSDLINLVQENDDKVIRYFIYKVNADYLLVHLGIFNDLTAVRPHSLQKSEKQLVEMGQSYYDYAAQYNHLIYRRPTAVSDVLDKLAYGFEDYQHILHAIRKEYFQVIEKMKQPQPQASVHANHAKTAPEQEALIKEKQDAFLDLYGAWLVSKSRELIPRMVILAEEIKALDPDFGFDIKLIQPSDDTTKRRET